MPERSATRSRRATPRAASRQAPRKRAIYDEDKEARRSALLGAARQLFLKHDGRLATVTEVAARAGVAKGTVYLYFQTKEELYVTRYEELIAGLLARMRAVCIGGRGDVRAGIVDAICTFVDEQPDFLRLGSLMNGVLEQNLSDEFIEAYKSRLGDALLATITALTEALAPLSIDDATSLFLRSYALTLGLWQQADLPRVVRRLLTRRPDLAFYAIDFRSELRSALTLIWQKPASSRSRAT